MRRSFEYNATAHQLSEADSATFYKKTYAHVAGGVLAFIIFEYLLLQNKTVVGLMMSMLQGYRWLIMLGGFMLVTNYAEKMSYQSTDKNKQYLAYGLYIFAEALLFIPLIAFAMRYTQNGALLNQAATVTLSLFTGLSAIVLVTKKDFSFLKSALTLGFFIAIGLVIGGVLFGFNLGLWFSVGMCALAGGSILYQTSNLVNNYHKDQYIAAALNLFAALMLLFWYVLRILMSRK